MASIAASLQELIDVLENIRDSQNSPPDEIFEKLDHLYSLQIKLEGASIDEATTEYKDLTSAMQDAVEKSQEAIKDLSKLTTTLATISSAIGKLAKLLA